MSRYEYRGRVTLPRLYHVFSCRAGGLPCHCLTFWRVAWQVELYHGLESRWGVN